MCGRLNVTDDPFVRQLMSLLGVPLYPTPKLNIAPGQTTSIIIGTNERPVLKDAYWSLLIEPKPSEKGFRPNPKWRTFNAQTRRLRQSKLWSTPYRHHRAIIPVSGFHEWKDGQCYNIQHTDSPMALAGLYKEWRFAQETIFSFTVITLPPQNEFKHIHSKSFPLLLLEQECIPWLDTTRSSVDHLDYLLQTGIRQHLKITPIDNPNQLAPIGHVQILRAKQTG